MQPRAAVALLAGAAVLSCQGSLHEAIDDETLRTFSGRGAGFNLLLITLDTTRADRLGCYGYEQARTPTIDALASRGLRFANVTAPAPLTLPSHSTLLTGLDVPSHGVRNNGTFRLSPDHTTLAETLGGAGYDTAAFVGSFVLDSRYGLDQGFELYDDDVNPEGLSAESGRFHERPADAVTDAALRWFDSRRDDAGPFFAWVHYFDPHAPYDPPEGFAAAHGARGYDGEVSFVDAQIGRIVDRLQSRGLLERTLVVLTADHGEGLGEHGERSHSLLIYESTMRVPLVFSNPVLFETEWVAEDRLVGLLDVVPSVLGLLDLPAPAEAEGIDLFAEENDPARALYIESMVPLLNYGWAPLTGLRRAGDKYIHAPTAEYYDLSDRPVEERNRFDGSDVAVELANALLERLSAWPAIEGLPDVSVGMDPETAARLAALGYVQSSVSDGSTSGLANPREMLEIWNNLSEAQILSSQGRHEEALAMQRALLETDPEDPRIWYAISLTQRRLNAFEAAEAALIRALELGPSADGYVRLAQLLLARESYDEFDRAIERARALEPDNGLIEIGAGDRLALAGDLEGALVFFRRALAVDPVRAGAVARQKIAAAEARLGK
jgi:arylsulfatase A-like enzyme/Flp pilus assembly protein TadD